MKHQYTLLSITFLLIATLQINCKKDNAEDGAAYSKYMIDTYIECNDFTVLSDGPLVKIQFIGNEIFAGNDLKGFHTIARQHNDTTYNRKLVRSRYMSINDSISEISIICDKDISEQYLAETELNSLFTFKAQTVYNIIQNNYNSYTAEQIAIPANKICYSNTRIIFPQCELLLNETPQIKGAYTFDFSIKLSSKTLTKKVTIDF